MSEHAFAVYALATRLYQGELIQVPMKAYTHDLIIYAKRLQNIRALALLILIIPPVRRLTRLHYVNLYYLA